MPACRPCRITRSRMPASLRSTGTAAGSRQNLKAHHRLAAQVALPGLPHLAEAAYAQRFFEHPIVRRAKDGRHAEAWRPRRQERQQVVGSVSGP